MKQTIIATYRGALEILKKKPVLLWGLSLLTQFLAALASIFGIVPIVYLPIVLALNASLSVLYLKGFRGEEVSSADIFTGFKKFMHVAGGMAWMGLWIILWSLIPIVGFVFAIIKAYEYAFTPYILITMPEIGATDALKKSKEMTKGLKAKMFWSEILIPVAVYIIVFVVGLLAMIPVLGILFGLALFIFLVLVAVLSPIFLGLIRAGFYDGAEKALAPKEEPAVEAVPETV